MSSTIQSLSDIVARNVSMIRDIEEAANRRRTKPQIISDNIAAFCGSTFFLWVHLIWFALWLAFNSLPMVPHKWQFDRPPFGNLTLIVSLEAIFLSTFILISQNRQQALFTERSHLDLQINMLAEQETSQMLGLLIQIRDHLHIPDSGQESMEAAVLKTNTDVKEVIEQLENQLDSVNDQ